MSVSRFPEWQKACEDALAERDPREIFRGILVAEAAIFRRLQGVGIGIESDELEAIDAMMIQLRVLTEELRQSGTRTRAKCAGEQAG